MPGICDWNAEEAYYPKHLKEHLTQGIIPLRGNIV